MDVCFSKRRRKSACVSTYQHILRLHVLVNDFRKARVHECQAARYICGLNNKNISLCI